MILKQLKPRQALNKAYLKLKPDRKKMNVLKIIYGKCRDNLQLNYTIQINN